MPELPEVETTRRGIEPHLQAHKVTEVIIRRSKLRWPIPTEITRRLVGQSFTAIQRRAKYLLLETPVGTLIIHLGMSGRLRINPLDTPLNKHDHVDILLSNNSLLRYTDPRRFGAILWTEQDPHLHPLLKNLGPEPLSAQFNAAYLFKYSRKRQLNIKQLLMDSKAVVGVGNIYANEALFQSGIHPLKPAKELDKVACTKLVSAVKAILKKAIAAGGTTLKDFISADGKPGYFKQELLVYGRENQACLTCHENLKRIVIGQRATVFCEGCQT